MHIAYMVSLDPYKSRTGTEVGARNVAEAMADRGHDVTIFHGYADQSAVTDRSGLKTVGLHHTGIRFVAGMEANRRVLHAIRQADDKPFDVVDMFGSGLGFAFHRLREMRSTRVYHAMDLAMLEWAALDERKLTLFPFYLGLARAERRAIRAANVIIAISRGTQIGLEERYPSCRTPSHVVPLPLQESWYSVAPASERRHFLYIAAGRRRRTDVFLRALAHLNGEGFPAKGIIIREARPEFHRMARNLGVDVEFLNDVPLATLRDCYARAYAYVLPSQREGMCLPVVEAASQSTPTISSPLPSVQDFVTNGETGLLVPGDDPSTWAEKMYLLATDSHLQETLGTRAKAKASTYRASHIATILEKLYTEQGS